MDDQHATGLPAVIERGPGKRPKPDKHGKHDLAHSHRKAAEHYAKAVEHHLRAAAAHADGSLKQAMTEALLAIGQAAHGERHARDVAQLYAQPHD